MTLTYGVETLQGPTKGAKPLSVATEIIALYGCFPVDKETSPTKGYPLQWREELSWTTYQSGYGGEEFWGASTLNRSGGFVTPKSCETLLNLFALTPVLIYNFFDPANHLTTITAESVTFTALLPTQPIAEKFACIDTFAVTDDPMTLTYIEGTDYSLERNATTGFVEVTRITTGAIGATDSVLVTYKYCDPTLIVDADIVAAIAKGNDIITELGFGKIPGWLHCPEYSRIAVNGSDPAVVRAALKTQAIALNTVFTTRFIYDIDETAYNVTVAAGSPDLQEIYDDKDVMSEHGRTTQGRGTSTGRTEQLLSDWWLAAHTEEVSLNQFPAASPSMRVLEDFTPDNKHAWPLVSNAIRDRGIITVILDPGDRGWCLWGTWTSYFNGTATDLAKDSTNQNDVYNYLNKAMTRDIWINNTDRNFNATSAQLIIEKWNGLGAQQVGKGKMLGWELSFLPSDNLDLSLKVVYRLSLLAPEPQKKTEIIMQFDLNYLDTVFG